MGRRLHQEDPLFAKYKKQFDLKECVVIMGDIKKYDPAKFTLVKQKPKPISVEILSDNIIPNSRRNKYKCNECPLRFKDYEQLKVHKLVHEEPEKEEDEEEEEGNDKNGCTSPVESEAAVESSSSDDDLDDEPPQKYPCSYCPKVFRHDYTYAKHLKTHTLLACVKCNKVVHTKGELNLHLQKEHNYCPCHLCPQLFYSQTNLDTHIALKHAKKAVLCYGCGAKFEHRDELKKHHKDHPGHEQIVHCSLCNAKFKNDKALLKHEATHFGKPGTAKEAAKKEIHRCNICGITFIGKEYLEQHLKEHLNNVLDTDNVNSNVVLDQKKVVGDAKKTDVTKTAVAVSVATTTTVQAGNILKPLLTTSTTSPLVINNLNKQVINANQLKLVMINDKTYAILPEDVTPGNGMIRLVVNDPNQSGGQTVLQTLPALQPIGVQPAINQTIVLPNAQTNSQISITNKTYNSNSGMNIVYGTKQNENQNVAKTLLPAIVKVASVGEAVSVAGNTMSVTNAMSGMNLVSTSAGLICTPSNAIGGVVNATGGAIMASNPFIMASNTVGLPLGNASTSQPRIMSINIPSSMGSMDLNIPQLAALVGTPQIKIIASTAGQQPSDTVTASVNTNPTTTSVNTVKMSLPVPTTAAQPCSSGIKRVVYSPTVCTSQNKCIRIVTPGLQTTAGVKQVTSSTPTTSGILMVSAKTVNVPTCTTTAASKVVKKPDSQVTGKLLGPQMVGAAKSGIQITMKNVSQAFTSGTKTVVTSCPTKYKLGSTGKIIVTSTTTNPTKPHSTITKKGKIIGIIRNTVPPLAALQDDQGPKIAATQQNLEQVETTAEQTDLNIEKGMDDSNKVVKTVNMPPLIFQTPSPAEANSSSTSSDSTSQAIPESTAPDESSKSTSSENISTSTVQEASAPESGINHESETNTELTTGDVNSDLVTTNPELRKLGEGLKDVRLTVIPEFEIASSSSVPVDKPKIFLKPLSQLLEQPDDPQQSNETTSEEKGEGESSEAKAGGKTKRTYKCSKCNAVCKRAGKLLQHMNKYRCKLCEFTSCTLKILDGHYSEKHEYKNRCVSCDTQFPTLSELQQHKKSVHLCRQCNRCYFDLKKHQNNYRCSNCDFFACSAGNLDVHYKCVHRITTRCAPCNVTFYSNETFQKHKQDVHYCERCCNYKMDLNVHKTFCKGNGQPAAASVVVEEVIDLDSD